MDKGDKQEKKNFDKAKYLKNVRAFEQQMNFKKNFEEEGSDISRRVQLSSKYRDRAQERKLGQVDANEESDGEYGYLEDLNEKNDENNEINVAKQYGLDFNDEKDKYQLQENVVRLKGLDFSLLKKEQEKAKAEKQSEKEKINAAKTLESIKESLSKRKKEPSDFAKRVMGVYDKRYITNEKVTQKGVAFPIPFSYYEYEIKGNNIMSEIPSIVLKEKSEEDEYMVIPTIGPDALEGLTRIITIYSERGKKGLKEERERLEKLKKEQEQKMQIEENELDLFGDTNNDLFEQNVKQSEILLKQEQEKQEDIFKDVKDYKEMIIEEQKKEFLKQKLENIINPNESASQQMGTRLNDKRKNPFEIEEDDYYNECFPKVAPSMNQIKELRERDKVFGSSEPVKKKKNDTFGRKLAAVERVIKEKQDLQNKS
ncbi:hypothetical protein ABPG74_018201 [Tetrahymena malaccensis]